MATTKLGETATLDMGPGTLAIPLSLFRDNRLRVCTALKAIPNVGDDNAFILLQGGDSINLYNTDVEYNFRQVTKSEFQFVLISFANKFKCVHNIMIFNSP